MGKFTILSVSSPLSLGLSLWLFESQRAPPFLFGIFSWPFLPGKKDEETKEKAGETRSRFQRPRERAVKVKDRQPQLHLSQQSRTIVAEIKLRLSVFSLFISFPNRKYVPSPKAATSVNEKTKCPISRRQENPDLL